MKIVKTAIMCMVIALAMGGVHAQLGRQSFPDFDSTSDLNVEASSMTMPEPGITPDSPFYAFKRLGEGVRIFFAGGAERERLHSELARQRLSEVRKMLQTNRTDDVMMLLKDYEREIDNINNDDAAMMGRHAIFLSHIENGAPGDIKLAFEAAFNRSVEKRIVMNFKIKRINRSMDLEMHEEMERLHMQYP